MRTREVLLYLAACLALSAGSRLKPIGAVKSVPETPVTGSNLQVCMSRNQTCCNKKMEERYQVAAHRDIQNLLHTSSSGLKLLISHNVAVLQESVESVVRQAENHTLTFLHSYHLLANHTPALVREFFTDVSLLVLGSELSLEEASQRFFDALFPLVYEQLVEPGLSRLTPTYAECIRVSCRTLAPYSAAPGRLATHITRASTPQRDFLQALHLGVEVINTTDHLQLSRECRRALLRMNYCPHCQGLTSSRPCMGYCLNVMRGCLANLAEVDSHWREFVRALEALSARMHGAQDLEQVLMGVHRLIGDTVAHAQRNGPRLSTQVHRMCGHPGRQTDQTDGVQHTNSGRDSFPLTGPVRNTEDSLTNRRQEFLSSLRKFRTFYGGLTDQLCASNLASADGLSCWNGADVVKSYTLRVVGSGIKAQAENPEVNVKEADPAISQVIDKLKHINQLLQGRSIPKLGTLEQMETGSGDGSSGNCDDEDECWGSGNGATERRRTITIFILSSVPRLKASSTEVTPENSNHRRYHHPQTTDDQMNSGTRETHAVSHALMLICASVLFSG